jgi:hypothetical protein
MGLFTSFGFAMALYLAAQERQVRTYDDPRRRRLDPMVSH